MSTRTKKLHKPRELARKYSERNLWVGNERFSQLVENAWYAGYKVGRLHERTKVKR